MMPPSLTRRFRFALAAFLLIPFFIQAQQNNTKVVPSADGWRLMVDGKPFFVNGINWDHSPIGTNYEYNFWSQSPEYIKKVLDYEMTLLKNIGVNAVRVYTGIPKEWISYIYKEHGIYTMLNHSFGRYGLMLNGNWFANTEYADESTQKLLLAETTELAKTYAGTPGLLLYLLGNENNYGLFWEGAETENIPVPDRKSTKRALAMYQLFNRAVVEMKKMDSSRPIAICNGDLLYVDIIKTAAPDIDILGVNVYRGATFTDMFERAKKEINKPLLLTEFGSDVYNVKTAQEDQPSQAFYVRENWRDVYANAAGLGKSGNSLGGFTFQFSDGWWKFGQTYNLDVHDTNASWSNGGYQFDYSTGVNNMNEEWFGVLAKGSRKVDGSYDLFPRAAYFVLGKAHQFNPYASGKKKVDVQAFFDAISIEEAHAQALKQKNSSDKKQ